MGDDAEYIDDDSQAYDEGVTAGDESQIKDDSVSTEGDDAAPAWSSKKACAKTLKITVTRNNKWTVEPAGVKALDRFSIIELCNNSNERLEVGFVPNTYIASGTNNEIEPYECKLFYVDKPKSKPAQSFVIRAAFKNNFFESAKFLICP